MSYIDKLRILPEKKRRIVAFTGAFLTTLVVFSIWINSFTNRSSRIIKNEPALEAQKELSPFSVLKNNLTAVNEATKKQVEFLRLQLSPK